MSKCIISGIETENKHKNMPISGDVISLAKDLVAETGCSMLDAFEHISFMLVNEIKDRLIKGETPDESIS